MTSVNVKNDFKISMCFMLLYRCLVGHVEVLIDDVGTFYGNGFSAVNVHKHERRI